MVRITNKKDCCGCAACVQICPKQCITMVSDEEGFLYPKVDETICIQCGVCEQICPMLNPAQSQKPKSIYAGINPDENTRRISSSGGVFFLLACKTIQEGGAVFGACFDRQWVVRHDCTETVEDLEKFLGSKYVQSETGDCYAKAEHYLKIGREVLFSGTACQIAGLLSFLKKPFDNLITVDVLCHGVPSPLIWRDYLEYECNQHQVNISDLTDVSFRDKQVGWRRFGMSIKSGENLLVSEPLDRNVYLKGFLRDLYLRPSCYQCQFRCGKCHSDITIADYWGIWKHHPQWDDDKGTSLVLINSEKGLNVFRSLDLKKVETSYEEALSGNSPLEHSVKETQYRQLFWNRYPTDGIKAIDSICLQLRPNVFKRILRKALSLLNR